MSDASVFKKRTFPIIFMFGVTLVFISITSVIYTFTRDTIRLNETLVLKRAILTAAGLQLPSSPTEVEKLYASSVSEVKNQSGGVLYYVITGPDSNEVQGYVVISTGSGLWGDITAAVGIAKDKNTLTGIDIISQNETPGLGGRITEPWFTKQFRGKEGPLTAVPEGAPADKHQFDGITGASYSTAAIKTIVNSTLQEAQNVIKS
jgi:Na+-transporting NADH:ubiquinone oxidoreductase subunit C